VTGTAGWRRARGAGLSLRIALACDRPFLSALYASTRTEELAQSAWPDALQRDFLEQQFTAQHDHYRRHYAGADFLVVEREGDPIGRLYLARWPGEHRIVDISLLPQARGKGLGTALLGDLIEEAAEAGCSLSIHVERMNPALSLYRRLGFQLVEDKGVYLLLAVPADQAEADLT
jgi:GNAT superfamily N-acetyltransferase